MINNYIFLDIDGVLNSGFGYETNKLIDNNYDLYEDLHLRNLLILKYLIKYIPNVKIIINTSWGINARYLIEKSFRVCNIPDPDFSLFFSNFKNKENRILEFINIHSISKYNIVIIEDEDMYNTLKDRLVLTNPHDGLTHNDCIKIWNLFGIKNHIFTK